MSPVQMKKAAPKAAPGLLSMEFYATGGGIPEGNYCLIFEVKMNQAVDRKTNQPRGPERLGVMLKLLDLSAPTEPPRTRFLSMGRKAHLSWAPDPDSGKNVVRVPGGPDTPLPGSSNWGYFVKSLIDCGAPTVADLSELDGMWAHVTNVPEPDERAGFQKDETSEDAMEGEVKGPKTIIVVSEILEDGKPWEGTGGLLEGMDPDAEPAGKQQPKPAAPKPGVRPVAKPVAAAPKAVAKPVAKKVAAPVEEEAAEEATDTEAMAEEAQKHLTTLIATNAKPSKAQARAAIFKAIKDKNFANQILATYFESDDDLLPLVETLGYTIQGPNLVPAA